MKSLPLSILLFSALTIVSDICSAEAVVRIYCDEKDIGTKIFINNQEKGGCDDTLFLSPGRKKLRAIKAVNTEYEQIFEQDFNLFDGAVKRIDISLSKPKLTEVARKARQLMAQQEEERSARSALQTAQAGNIKAMEAVAQRYATGKGLQQNSERAQFWRKTAKEERAKDQFRAKLKTANSGDIRAMETVAHYYETGNGVERNNIEAHRWQQNASTAKQEKINQEITQRKREAEERERAEKATRRAELNRELEDFSFFPDSSSLFDPNHQNSKGSSIVNTFTLPILLVSDTISLPSKTTQYQKLKSKRASLPSKWAKPNSMIAKAYLQKKSNNL